ncbi:Putative fatty acyl-CoA reductase [Cladobotryum mycophilum]|uniref:Fatty acyl-CoA reductase n=1 Tax=Cladobotryum mycophilum TaxID=491253 RepID=A0ABR0SHK7_9HYPO
MVQELRLSGKLVIWDGDITHPDCGLTVDQVSLIHDKVSLFIHGASTINLQKPLVEVAKHIIYPSLTLAKMALGCANLTRFVYISTAYTNAFLRKALNGSVERYDAVIEEDIHHIRSHPSASAAMELSDLEAYGSTPEYEFVRHPFPYSYAKHLTERLLLEFFNEAQLDHMLLIFRPSCIGPAESKPYPFYEVPGSSPVTVCLAAAVACPPMTLNFSSHLKDPSTANIDEVPVDIVVNRLIAHVAFESSGCVHAVGGSRGRHTTDELFNAVIQFRRFWWAYPKITWYDDYWKSDRLCKPARLFVITGCSFIFDEAKTDLIWDRMSVSERSTWPLYQCENSSTDERVAGRQKALALIVGRMINKFYGLPAHLTWLFHASSSI